MTVNIREYVSLCETCAQIKLNSHANKAPMQPIEVNEPFVFCAMDYMGPSPEAARGNKHLLVVMDHFTKWCEMFPTKDQQARTVAEILVNRVFSRFGPPIVIQFDQGRNFESHIIQEVCRLIGTHKSRTIAYHPQCDGLVERENSTIQGILTSFVSDHPHDWDNWVSLAVFAYNTACHESTGFSPYEMVVGRMVRTPLELDLDLALLNPRSQSEYAQSIRKSLQSIISSAQKKLTVSRAKQTGNYDSLHSIQWSPFLPGSSVLLHRPKAWKFRRRWIGPYDVLSRNGVNYKIKSKDGKIMVVHHDNLKQCAVPVNKGVLYHPVPKSMDVTFGEGPSTTGEGTRRQQQRLHPARLRRNTGPPLRYGDIVTHKKI